jgi:integrase/recombinase XerC
MIMRTKEESMETTPVQALVQAPRAPLALEPMTARGLVESFLAGRNPRTLAAYRADLETFRAFTGAPTPDDAAYFLLARGHGEANGLALSYRAHLIERGLSPATVNRRLAALRSLVKLARTLGLVAWTLEAPSVKTEPYRDTRGPGRRGFDLLLEELERRGDRKAVRDRALLRLLFDLALRRGEAVSLDLADLDLEAGTVAVIGKGKRERLLLTLPPETSTALASWLEVRGQAPGPLFVNLDRAKKGARLTGRSVARLLDALGRRVGLAVRPHGLRHAAITFALDRTGGDVRRVQRYSRHADLRTLNRYDDNREDLAGEVARLVASGS